MLAQRGVSRSHAATVTPLQVLSKYRYVSRDTEIYRNSDFAYESSLTIMVRTYATYLHLTISRKYFIFILADNFY